MKRFILFVLIWICLWVTPVHAGTIDVSGATVATLITTVRYNLNETTATFWADAEFILWCDEAITEIVNQTRCLEHAFTSIKLVDMDFDYELASSYLDIEAVYHNNADITDPYIIISLQRMDIKDFAHIRESGRPKFWTLWGDLILIWPLPDTTYAGTYLYVYYVTLPTGVSQTTSAIETPAYFDPAIIDYMCAKALYKDNKPILADKYMASFQNRINIYNVNIVHHQAGEKVGQ